MPVLALDAEGRGLLSGVDKTRWNALMTREALWGPDWLLSYEAHLKGWLPSSAVADHVGADPCFKFLRGFGVSFYNTRASSLVTPKWRQPLWMSQLIGYTL